MTELALRFLALLGPISVYGVFVRLMEKQPPETWVPLLILSVVVNAATVCVVWRNRHAGQHGEPDELIEYRDDE